MPESWFSLSDDDQSEALEVASSRTGRPPHLLEKDIWVVWTLDTLYQSHLGQNLTFKGGTSLSKAYGLIDRFSEDIDLTYNILALVPDLLQERNPTPTTASQAKKISSAVRARLPEWISETVLPLLHEGLRKTGIKAELAITGKDQDKVELTYSALKTGTGYSESNIKLEFGARATGEPHQFQTIVCDAAKAFDEINFPSAAPCVMKAERTFWEKATAAHVYCLQGRMRGERYSRHWHDLAAFTKSPLLQLAVRDHDLARQVAQHKNLFFIEKDADGKKIDYLNAATGGLRIIPSGQSRTALEKDYQLMIEDGFLSAAQPDFDDVLNACAIIENLANQM